MFERSTFLKPLLFDVMSRQSKSWPTYDGGQLDRTKYVSASEIDRCERMVKFGKVYPNEGTSIYGWGFAERGHAIEAWYAEKVMHIPGYRFEYTGGAQRSFYDQCQSGTPDGVMFTDDNGVWVLDYKSIDPRTNVSNLPKKEHMAQVIQNMDLVEACLDIDVAGGLLLYINASDISEMHEYVVDRNSPKVGEEMMRLERRAKRIVEAETPDELEPEGLYNGQCKNCAYASLCSASIVNAKQEKANAEKIIDASRSVFGQRKA